MLHYNNSILKIDLVAIKNNYRILQNIAPTTIMGAAVKANCYGLGMNEIVPALYDAGCRDFFVANLDEAIALRSFNQIANIYLLNGILEKGDLELIKNYRLIPVLNNLSQIEIAKTLPMLEVVLHFDTGLNRFAITMSEQKKITQEFIKDIKSKLRVKYIMSHLACADQHDNSYNIYQLNYIKAISQKWQNIPVSLANSSSIFLGKEFHFDLARPGMALYGLNPVSKKNPMLPVINISSKIIHLNYLSEDSYIGYGCSRLMPKGSIIATIACGYGDGISRILSNSGHLYINSLPVEIVGRVSMDYINIDVSKITNPYIGQEVEIIGLNNKIDEFAHENKLFQYEVLTSIGTRYKKLYINDKDIFMQQEESNSRASKEI